MPIRRFLVIHHTSGGSAQSSIDFWNTPEAKGASAHVIIDRDGKVIQIRPFNRTCGHAGKSKWKDPNTGVLYQGLNQCSIGIELANAGEDVELAKRVAKKAGKTAEFVAARHQNGGPVEEWEVYPLVQLQALAAVSKALVVRYRLDDVVRHSDVAASRKNDTGPSLDFKWLRSQCGFGWPMPPAMG